MEAANHCQLLSKNLTNGKFEFPDERKIPKLIWNMQRPQSFSPAPRPISFRSRPRVHFLFPVSHLMNAFGVSISRLRKRLFCSLIYELRNVIIKSSVFSLMMYMHFGTQGWHFLQIKCLKNIQIDKPSFTSKTHPAQNRRWQKQIINVPDRH